MRAAGGTMRQVRREFQELMLALSLKKCAHENTMAALRAQLDRLTTASGETSAVYDELRSRVEEEEREVWSPKLEKVKRECASAEAAAEAAEAKRMADLKVSMEVGGNLLNSEDSLRGAKFGGQPPFVFVLCQWPLPMASASINHMGRPGSSMRCT